MAAAGYWKIPRHSRCIECPGEIPALAYPASGACAVKGRALKKGTRPVGRNQEAAADNGRRTMMPPADREATWRALIAAS
ncbi:unnamed protein product, partial [Iphiclides podalirius]